MVGRRCHCSADARQWPTVTSAHTYSLKETSRNGCVSLSAHSQLTNAFASNTRTRPSKHTHTRKHWFTFTKTHQIRLYATSQRYKVSFHEIKSEFTVNFGQSANQACSHSSETRTVQRDASIHQKPLWFLVDLYKPVVSSAPLLLSS